MDNITLSSTQKMESSSAELYGSDSNKLSIEISTNQLVNNDLIKSFDFNIYDYIGDARYINSSSYGDLDKVRELYLSRYPNNSVNPFMIFTQTEGYDYAVIESIKKVVPFKADFKTGFRVEQSALERFKARTIPSTRGNRNDSEIRLDLSNIVSLEKSDKYDKPTIFIDTVADVVFDNSSKDDYSCIFNATDALDLSKSSIYDYSAITEYSFSNLMSLSTFVQTVTDDINIYISDKVSGKTDKYKIRVGSSLDVSGSGTPLTRVPGFSSYVNRSIVPISEFHTYYIKSGSSYSLAYDSSTKPTWVVTNNVFTASYSSTHVSLTRNGHYSNLFRGGTVQVLKCDFDGKKVIEITRTTSKTPIVYDTKKNDIILRAE